MPHPRNDSHINKIRVIVVKTIGLGSLPEGQTGLAVEGLTVPRVSVLRVEALEFRFGRGFMALHDWREAISMGPLGALFCAHCRKS